MDLRNDTGVLKLTIGLVLAGLLLFGQSLNDPFHFDDVLILNDSNVANPAQWSHFFNPLHLRQLTFFSFYLNHLFSGDNPASYHLVNVLLHSANAVLLFVLLTRFFDRRFALIAALIFLVHPIQTEPVMYVYQRSVLLACSFSLLALIAYQSNRRWLALLLFVLAFESKEAALAVPLLVVILSRGAAKECSPGREAGVNGIAKAQSPGGAKDPDRSYAPPGLDASARQNPGLTAGATLFRPSGALMLGLVVVLATAGIGILFFRHEATVGIGAMQSTSPIAYFLTETRVIYTYMRLLVFPFPQSLEYDFAVTRALSIQVILQILGLMTILATGIYFARSEKWRVTGLAIVAFFILLAPTSTIIPSADPAFEHRLYFPMLAFAVFAASIIERVKKPPRKWIAAPIVVLLSIATLGRGAVWGTDARLWEDTVQRAPNKARAWFNLGGAYIQTNPNRAREAYLRTIALRPDYAEAYYDLGVMDQVKGNYPSAIGYYEKTVDLNSTYWPAWNNLGNSLLSLGEKDRALKAFETTLRLNPDHWPSQYNLAIVHFNSGRFDEAIPRLRTVLDWRPEFQDARYLLAVSLNRTGQQAEAEREWKKLGKTGQPPMPAAIPAPAR